MYNNKWKAILLPMIIALAIVVGMWLNTLFYHPQMVRAVQNTFIPVQGSKLDMILNMINFSYVDTVNVKDIEEIAIP